MAENGQIRIALAGNPNCGKTTMFNNITGAKQHVGNYAGVTVEKKEGYTKFDGHELLFIDLPGTYSLTARSLDELVARNVIVNDNPDVIVNVLDASNLERNLYLAAQLVELEKPMVIALNMADVAEDMGIKYDLKKMAEMTGATIVSTVGRTNIGTKELLEATVSVAASQKAPGVTINYGDLLEGKISELVEELKQAGTVTYPLRWVAVKLLEKDADVIGKVMRFENTETVIEKAKAIREEIKDQVDLDVVFQEYRHRFAVEVYNACLTQAPTQLETRSDRYDKILTHRILGLPIFMVVMWLLFNFVNTVGAIPQTWITDGFTALQAWVVTVIPEGQLQSLISDGIIAGVGAVLSFVPLILLLFLGISFLEDTGYMARAAFVIDRVMRACGLHGKSFIPLLLGFGCSVPSVMGARILDNYKDRMVTILITPFMSCSARLPVYTLFAAAFFPPEWAGTVVFGVYALGIVFGIVFAKIFRKYLFAGEAEPFVMELPPYHLPTLKATLTHMFERGIMYLKKAGTFILSASILVWFITTYPMDVEYSKDYDALHDQVAQTYEMKDAETLAHFGITTDEQKDQVNEIVDNMKSTVADATTQAEDAGEDAPEIEVEDDSEAPELFNDIKEQNEQLFPVAWSMYKNSVNLDDENQKIDQEQNSEKLEQSYAAMFGKAINPVLKPLGFDWKIGVSLVAGLAAKEVVVSTLGTIYAVGGDTLHPQALTDYLQNDPDFTPLVALTLMLFILIYPPCIAALAVIKRETGSWKWMLFMFFYENAFAWIACFIFYNIGLALGF
ncbi:ferrous iron transport protein B [Veillonella parvula DSM 2008]|uniref:ferrous iron transport protein B n=1 Tax=Veillonella parvula TaxID=29466 RepID=UPI00019D6431|nr:ferrous iron transport protein B [Veillonella parvula]ACZ24315.1 ferrous iron transport protein B [Veillonella parvula DSM 2008]QQB16419.1 ferrous iron transport protein B [Veillonella parvula]SNU95979.1 Ferrous iron transport protein B [Veillonella parvula]